MGAIRDSKKAARVMKAVTRFEKFVENEEGFDFTYDYDIETCIFTICFTEAHNNPSTSNDAMSFNLHIMYLFIDIFINHFKKRIAMAKEDAILKRKGEWVSPKNELKPFLTPRQELGLE